MNTSDLHAIVIEDNEDDALLMVREVQKNGYDVQWQRVQTSLEFRTALTTGSCDVILADYTLPQFSAPEALDILKESGLDIPFLVISGTIGEDAAVALVKSGANDYVMKRNMRRLGQVVERELREFDVRKRKRGAERALAESEERYRLLYERAPIPYQSLDIDGNLLEVNDSWLTTLGYTREEIIGRWFGDFLTPGLRDKFRTNFPKFKAAGEITGIEFQMVRKNGSTVLVSFDGKIGHNELGAFKQTHCILTDITERRHAEEEIRSLLTKVQAEKELQTRLLNSMTDEVWFADETGHFTLENPAACKAFALENPANIDIQSFAESLEVLRPDGSPRPVDETPPLRALAGETVTDQEEIIRLPLSGELRYRLVNSSPVRDPQGKIVGCVSVVRDITERKRAEEALRESEAFTKAVMDNLPFGVAVNSLDPAVEFTYMNDSFPRLYRTTREALSHPDGFWDAVYEEPAFREKMKKMVLEDIATGDPKHMQWVDVPISRKGAETTFVSAMNTSVPGKQLAISSVWDVTDRKKAETEKEALQMQLVQSQKMEAIGQLAGGVAHDFNNLLTGILGNVAILRSDLPASDPMVANLNSVETAARQAADLAKGLLTFSRRAVVAAVPLDMGEAIDTTLSILKQSLPATMNIVRDVEQPTWSVLADRSQIAQVILNLAVNARDAMQGKGTLTIRLRNEQVGEEYVRLHPFARVGESVHLSVADTGPGIPDEIREHLFEPFHTTKPASSGTGLGLSIVYGAVKQAAGWVTVDSPASGGAQFDIFLPRCLDKPIVQGVPDRISTNVCSGTVLVVEDEPVVSAVAQALLTRSGCAVLTAEDGASALRALEEHQRTIDLILLDMTMPGMTIQEIIPALRALSPSVPIVLTSGYTSSDTVKQMLEEGAVQGFLGKPYEMRELLDSVKLLLRRE
jgi:PAS domain S-box-containing protein